MLTDLQHNFIRQHTSGPLIATQGGHMLYTRALIDHHQNPWFIKAHTPTLFTDTRKKHEALRYLKKEDAVYSYLRGKGFKFLPDRHHFGEGVLLLSAYPESHGWHWDAPSNQTHSYISHILEAIDSLRDVAASPLFDAEKSLDYFWNTSWGTGVVSKESIQTLLNTFSDRLLPAANASLVRMHDNFYSIILSRALPHDNKISHFDLRQSNVAWHGKKGVRIIDWSWASYGYDKADSTMFLIDLHKSFIDVEDYLKSSFNSDFARLMIGFYLARAIQPTVKGNESVRYHQLVSAISAYELLEIT